MKTPDQNDKQKPANQSLTTSDGSVVGGEFYNGIEWMASWMLDNVEGEQVDEITLRQWAVNAWLLHLEKQNK